jgi:hypothetical protein
MMAEAMARHLDDAARACARTREAAAEVDVPRPGGEQLDDHGDRPEPSAPVAHRPVDDGVRGPASAREPSRRHLRRGAQHAAAAVRASGAGRARTGVVAIGGVVA